MFPSQAFKLKTLLGKVDSGKATDCVNLSALPSVAKIQVCASLPVALVVIPLSRATSQSQTYCNRRQEMCSFQRLDNFVFYWCDAGITCLEFILFSALQKDSEIYQPAYTKLSTGFVAHTLNLWHLLPWDVVMAITLWKGIRQFHIGVVYWYLPGMLPKYNL